MSFVAILVAAPNGRVGKFQEFPTQAEADAHVAAFQARYPTAFVAETPVAPWSHWLVDMVAKTVDVSLPAPAPWRVSKVTLIDRMTDGELDSLRTFITANTRRIERWRAEVEVRSDDPQVRAVFENLFGAARADALLAPEV